MANSSIHRGKSRDLESASSSTFQITAIDGVPTSGRMALPGRRFSYSTHQDSAPRIATYFLTAGNVKDKAKLALLDKKGKRKTPEAKRVGSYEGNIFPKPLFPHPIAYKVLPGNIGYLQIHTFSDPAVATYFDSLFYRLLSLMPLLLM